MPLEIPQWVLLKFTLRKCLYSLITMVTIQYNVLVMSLAITYYKILLIFVLAMSLAFNISLELLYISLWLYHKKA